MEREYFTLEGAQAKVSREIQTIRTLSGVPAGTTSTVINFNESPRLGYTLFIEWHLPTEKREVSTFSIGGESVVMVSGGKPLVDWFSRDEYKRFLREL